MNPMQLCKRLLSSIENLASRLGRIGLSQVMQTSSFFSIEFGIYSTHTHAHTYSIREEKKNLTEEQVLF